MSERFIYYFVALFLIIGVDRFLSLVIASEILTIELIIFIPALTVWLIEGK